MLRTTRNVAARVAFIPRRLSHTHYTPITPVQPPHMNPQKKARLDAWKKHVAEVMKQSGQAHEEKVELKYDENGRILNPPLPPYVPTPQHKRKLEARAAKKARQEINVPGHEKPVASIPAPGAVPGYRGTVPPFVRIDHKQLPDYKPPSSAVDYDALAKQEQEGVSGEQQEQPAILDAVSANPLTREVELNGPDKFAIVDINASQFKVLKGDRVMVNYMAKAEIGQKLEFDRVLLVGTRDYTLLGLPTVAQAKVVATVEQHTQLAKVIVFKKKRRKGYQRTYGHRDWVTILHIDDVIAPDAAATEANKVVIPQ